MITTQGKIYIKRYLGGQVGSIANAISIGVGGSSEIVGSTALDFEITRCDVSLTSYDFANNDIIFKGSLPDEAAGIVYEVGLWSQFTNTSAGHNESRLLTTFDSATESWSTGTFSGTNTRIGADGLRLAPAASTTSSSVLSGLSIDLSGDSSVDKFLLAFYNLNANASTVVFRLRTDASNYYEFSIATPTTGYNVQSRTKGSATVTGSPNWATINEIEVRVTSTSGGASQVDFDGIRVEDTDSVSPEYVLIAREVITPITVVSGGAQDIEVRLGVTV